MNIPSLVASAILTLAVSHARAQTTWPQDVTSSAGEVTIYQPQIDSYTGNQFTAHTAVSVARPDGKPPLFGAVFFTATVATDRGADIVTVQNIAVTNSRFPNADAGTADAVGKALVQAGADGEITLSQDQLLAQLALTQKEAAAAADLNNTPPQILFATQPSVLVSIAGEPKLAQAPDSPILTVVNSPFFIALDPATRTYYLHGGGQWLSTADILEGPWTATSGVPEAVTTLAASQTQAQPAAAAPAASQPPQIIVATQPTELIQTTGPAEYSPVDGTNLLYVSNTDSDVFMDIDSQSLYVLLSGRWFSAATQSGPWTYAAQLPPDFSKIPPGLPISNVLASVPGTPPAKTAVLDAQVPQTAVIQRDAPGPDVPYDGEPKFEPVAESSAVSYAVNTTHDVVELDDTYYVCDSGVWYHASGATGPWTVSLVVPPAIYTIPPTCPVYPVTYCKIYTYTDDTVSCGYLPGYTGSLVSNGAIVYGTGWPYDPWFGSVFIPRPVTWGFGATFSTGWGAWGFGIGAGWGAASFACSWNSGWWGSANSHWNNWSWNNRWNRNVNITRNVTNTTTNNFNTHIHRSANNIYRNHPDRLTAGERARLQRNEQHLANRDTHLQNQIDRDRVDTGNVAADVQRQSDRRQENRDEARQEVDQRALQSHPHRNDVFADRDGNVYRHDPDAGWQRHEAGQWRRPADGHGEFQRNRGELNRQFAARSHGGGFHGGGRRR